jgi:hypothetical protein
MRCMSPEWLTATNILTGCSAAALLGRERLLDKISRKSSADLQACSSPEVYIYRIVDGRGNATMA